MPRYATFRVPTCGYDPDVDKLIKTVLQPGDRVVSIYPIAYHKEGVYSTKPVVLNALVELRHPSWVEKNIGYDTDEPKEHQEPK